MPGTVLILGGYGNFGKRIAEALTADGIPVIIAGRSADKATGLCQRLPAGLAEPAVFDVHDQFAEQLTRLQPAVVINTCGPFQTSDYRVAECCIDHGIHYLDLADGRDFVTGITVLDDRARQRGVAVISGASTVPGLSSAVLEHLKPRFEAFEHLRFGISPGQRAERGLATTRGIMTYVGRPLKPFAGADRPVYGWQDIYRQRYPELGYRWIANCDIPDLDLLPPRYGLKSIRFGAGLELAPLHLGLWGLSWLVRLGLPVNLPRYARPLLKASDGFDRFGSADGGMHMIVSGHDHQGRPLSCRWFIVARDGHGPYIPTVPAIVLARRLIRQPCVLTGALPCVGLVTLDEYLAQLKPYSISTYLDPA